MARHPGFRIFLAVLAAVFSCAAGPSAGGGGLPPWAADGTLLQNGGFAQDGKGGLAPWTLEKGLTLCPSAPTAGEACLQMAGEGKGLLVQTFAGEGLHAAGGDILHAQADLFCAKANTAALLVWVVYQVDGKPDKEEVRLPHPGDGEWRTLKCAVPVRNDPITRVQVLVELRGPEGECKARNAAAWQTAEP